MGARIYYGTSEEAWGGWRALITRLIKKYSTQTVCEVGGGANPLFSLDEVRQLGIDYHVLDISAHELAKAPSGYSTIVADIAATSLPVDHQFDLIFSAMVAEHIDDPAQFHHNVRSMLNPSGLAVHFFPTLYALPFLANRLLPEVVTQRLLGLMAPRDAFRRAKFPAYYKWCRGPIPAQIDRFTRLGYEVLEYSGFYGHGGYYRRLALVRSVHTSVASFLVSHPNPYLTSYAQIVLRRSGKM